MSVKRFRLAILLVLCGASLALAQGLPAASPESMGVSRQRLDRMSALVQDYVDRGRIAGVVTWMARNGKVVQFESYGQMDVERHQPMRKDAIFRIASVSKAVTTVAAMILMEEGKLLLSDPVSKFISAFKQTSVAVPPPGGSAAGGRFGIVPARREITIRDLMTHTSGISYGTGLAADQYKVAGIQGWYLADKKESISSLVDRLAALPFDAQPGEKFIYGFSTDVLGAVVEKVSGTDLETFFRTRIFEPLKMADSSFFLPAEKRDRLATVYSATPDDRIVRAPDGGIGQGDYVNGPRACLSGGAGLLSTASDYGRFLQMLLNGGELDGVRLLGPKTVEWMTANHLGGLYQEGLGFGLGFEIIVDPGRAGRLGSVGAYGWGSAYYPRYFVDPQEKLVALFLCQLIPAGNLDLHEKLGVLMYQSIVGPVPLAPAAAAKTR